MARKKLGHVELIWRCPRCGSANKGSLKTCESCGAPQPEDVKFEQPEDAVLIQDEETITKAEAGTDVHCPYCGTRNPAGSTVCSQCGGELEEGKRREAGQVLGAYGAAEAKQIPCPRCGAENPPGTLRCSQCGSPLEVKATAHVPAPQPAAAPRKGVSWLVIAGVIGVVLLCVVGGAFLLIRGAQTEDVRGTVQRVEWERSIPIEAQVMVDYQDWWDEVPAGAANVVCKDAFRYESNEPKPKSTEVCGTPYTVDQGSGFGEVVQDCTYRVYDEMCSYQVSEWRVVNTLVESGNDLEPYWPSVSLAAGQREGDEWEETYTVWFDASGEEYAYRVSEVDDFRNFQPGSEWVLTINGFGSLVDVNP